MTLHVLRRLLESAGVVFVPVFTEGGARVLDRLPPHG